MVARVVAFVFFIAGLALATFSGLALLLGVVLAFGNAFSGGRHGATHELITAIVWIALTAGAVLLGVVAARVAWRRTGIR